ncbi:rac GTPase-activating protein 1-like [Chrysoperla carnea]|uniref:rac GTPase-activating protein 1-like n=1 Tax=Chrysoperla carnea TaxID=189513 RepID=UPI001D06643E|nr:rac GTPase-activating protein 1-like [Chrysoperla carnea]
MTEPPKLSLVAQFDDLMRCVWGLLNNDETEAFLAIVLNFEEFCLKGIEAEKECQRLQSELNKQMLTISNLEKKLSHARSMYDTEKRQRLKAEHEIENLERNVNLVREILLTNENKNYLPNETREKLQFLHNSTSKSRRSYETSTRAKRLNTINELESTGSLLSDLSYSRSEDDLDMTGDWNGHRPCNAKQEEYHQKRRRSSQGKMIELNPNDRVVATTTLTVGKDGSQILATSVIEAVPEDEHEEISRISNKSRRQSYSSVPTTPHDNLDAVAKHKYSQVLGVSPSVQNLRNSESKCRPHTFVTKIMSGFPKDICGPCGKKMRFGTSSVRCKDCRSIAHIKCQHLIPLPCVPVGNTPTLKGTMGVIADYAPQFPPMIPALLVHCVNEIDMRGLHEIGPYRVPGSEKDVKTLKEKFLRGKGIPNLNGIEIPVICGTIKDFLRSLREPLLTNALRGDFIRAVEANDTEDIEPALYQTISELPQPNRDSLAFLMLHLQKISESKDCKMPITNISKIFGPTIVGYSIPEPDFGNMLSETRQQVSVVEHLLKIPSDYWLTLINVHGLQPRPIVTELKQTISTDSLNYQGNYFRTPTGVTPNEDRVIRNKRKFFDNTPSKKKVK